MTRRGGRRSWAARDRRGDRGGRMCAALNEINASPQLFAQIAWDQRNNTEGRTYALAYCRRCGRYRRDVGEQKFNARHPDGRLKAEAIMLAVAWYGRCRCGHSEIDILTPREKTEIREKVLQGPWPHMAKHLWSGRLRRVGETWSDPTPVVWAYH